MMKIELLLVGKNSKEIETIISHYEKRITRYNPFTIHIIPESKNIGGTRKELIKRNEANNILKKVAIDDYLILLDEKGSTYDSIEFSKQIESWMYTGKKKIVFLIGGAYGFHDEVYARKNEMISFSKFTFSHQVIRVMFMEQLYRAFTITHGEPYHHQ
jgi:23S rRNA (pseudouridine1915-N3)-methyltransferase